MLLLEELGASSEAFDAFLSLDSLKSGHMTRADFRRTCRSLGFGAHHGFKDADVNAVTTSPRSNADGCPMGSP